MSEPGTSGAAAAAVLSGLKDRHRSRPAFILGTGPSINEQDLTPLREHVTFGVNGIARMTERLGFEPTYYVLMDAVVARHAPDFAERTTSSLKFFSADLDWARAGAHPIRSAGLMGFSPDPARGLYTGYSVVHWCLQLAHYMGCDPVYLLGCDATYAGAQARCYDEPTPFRRPDVDVQNFDGISVLLRVAESFAVAHRVFERDGRRLFNATRGGCLEALPRVVYEEALAAAGQSPRVIDPGPRPRYLPPPPGPELADQVDEVNRWLAEDAAADGTQLQVPLACFDAGDAAGGWHFLAEYARRCGDRERAEGYWRRAFDLDPGLPAVAYNLGLLARERGDEAAAQACFRRELERWPAGPLVSRTARFNRMLTLRALGRPLEALPDIESLAREYPFTTPFRVHLAETLGETGRDSDGLEHLEFACGREPEDFYLWLRLGQTYRRLERDRESLRALQQAVVLAPRARWVNYELAQTCLKLGRWLDAELAFTREIELYDTPIAHLNRGRARQKMGRVYAAQRDIARAIELDPPCADAWLQLIDLYVETGRPRLALEKMRRAAELFPHDARFSRYLRVAERRLVPPRMST